MCSYRTVTRPSDEPFVGAGHAGYQHLSGSQSPLCEYLNSLLQTAKAAIYENPSLVSPKFFSRTLWLVLIVVLFSKALTLVYLLMNEDVLVDRQYSHGVALTLRAYWAADEEDRDKIADAAGLIRVVGGGVPEGEQHWPYSGVYQRQMQAELGADTEVRLRVHSPPALWVRAPSLGDGWLKVLCIRTRYAGKKYGVCWAGFWPLGCCPQRRHGSSSVSSINRSNDWFTRPAS